MDLQEQIIDDLGKQISKEIDFEILSGMLCELGWTKVILKPMPWEQGTVIDDWVSKHVHGHFETMGLVWLFESSKDATMFILKWSS